MPSAEKSTSASTALESIAPNEPKSVENTSNENQDEKSVQAQNSVQSCVSIISNKVRNLEKRKNKLDGYRQEEENGKELSIEQQKAVSKYDEVTQQLSLSKEFFKQFQKIASDAAKDAKREARKTLFARQHQETAKVREVLMIQDLLQRLKVESIRNDFLNQRNGACPINKAEMEFIDKLAKLVVPTRPNFSNEPSFANAAKTSAEIFSFLIDERNREFQDTGITFEKGKELFQRIQSCGYWEKDVKVVVEEKENGNSNDLEVKSEVQTEVKPVAAPVPAQVPIPTFNGNVMTVQQQMQNSRLPQQASMLSNVPTNAPNMKTTVTAVENAYFNQIKYSQQSVGPTINNSLPVVAPTANDFSTNFSFLQDSELDSPGPQQKMPVNVIQQKHQQSLPSQQFKNAAYHSQSPVTAAGQMYPPGLKVQQSQSSSPHIPVNYQMSPQQLNQPNAVSSSQVPPHMIPKQLANNGNQMPGYGSPSASINPQSTRPAGAAYQQMTPTAQYQQPNVKHEQKVDTNGDKEVVREKEKPREEYQEQPQIDTWTNETAQTGGNGNFQSRSSGGNYNRSNRQSSGSGGKFNNYRSQQPRSNFTENGSGDSPRESSSGSGTFFRNNERFNGSSTGNRGGYENRGGSGGNYKSRDGNYRAGSGRFSGTTAATTTAAAPTSQGLRK